MPFTVAAIYKFTPFADPAALRAPLAACCEAAGVRGTLLLASEGINGTVAGPPAGIETVLAHIRALPGCAETEVKTSEARQMPFLRMKVRLKREIVTLGQPGVNPCDAVGRYVDPADWNTLIDDPDTIVIDTRNDYEVAIGSFAGAVDPRTSSFREFPDWWARNHNRFAGRKVAMFCTGGIRCEKATSYLIGQGVKDVFHLKGGILKYLEDVPPGQSRWQGDCFVFDGRVSVGHGLAEGPHVLCHACRLPLAAADLEHPDYEPGVSCHNCAAERTDEDRARFRERQRQIEWARARGGAHLGGEARPEPSPADPR